MGNTYVLPDKDTLIEQIKAAGNVRAHATSIGMDESTLRRRILKAGWNEEVQKALKKSALIPERSGEAGKAGGKIAYSYPPNDQLVEECIASGSRSAYAQELGIPEATLRAHLRREGLVTTIDIGLLSAGKVSEVERLRAENKELQKALKKARGDEIAEERVIELLTREIEVAKPKYKAPPRKAGKGAEHEFVLLWSDLHAGEVVNPEEINGANSYDWEIMLARLGELRDSILSYKENRSFDVKRLHILALGDFLSGNIHDELKETNSVPLAEATVQLGLDAADWLAEFVPYFNEIRFAGVVGNHPRESRKPQAKRKFSNADWTCYQIMQQRLKSYPSIQFEIPKAQKHPVMVCGKRILMFHGDSVGPSAMVGVPTGGIVRHVGRLKNQYTTMDLSFDHAVAGHFHETNLWKGKDIIINGSVVGISEYGIERYGEGNNPMQLLLTFNTKHGLSDLSFLDMEAGVGNA